MPEPALLKVSVAPAESDEDGHGMEECTPEMVPCHFAPWQRASSTAMMLAAAAAEDDLADAPARAIKKQAWTPEEDAKLLAMVEHHGPSSWSQIALHLPGRVGKQCRERWHNHLSPEVKKENFTEDEVRPMPMPFVLACLAAVHHSLADRLAARLDVPGPHGACRTEDFPLTGPCASSPSPFSIRTDSSWRRLPSMAPSGLSS
jgi:hypothetical protein